VERRLAAILAADVVGYSRLIGVDETATLTALRSLLKELVEPTLKQHRGRVVKLMGDGLLAEFASIVDAVSAAVEIQEATPKRSADLPKDRRIALRIGVNIGDVAVEDGDLFGDGVNVAARLQEVAAPNGVAITDGAHRELRGRLDLPFEDVGEKTLKNIAEPVRIWLWSLTNTFDDLPVSEPPIVLPDKPSIAVLPFENMSGDIEQEFFSDGMTEDIITGLSRFRSLFVIARNSTFSYKGKTPDVREVARELGVRYVLEGSVRRAGNRIRITGQLIDAETGNHLWAERYDRDLDDIFVVQDEVTEAIVAAIAPEIDQMERDRAQRKPPDSLDAWGLYQRGLTAYHATTQKSQNSAIKLFDRVNELDPTFAPAFAMAAGARCRLVLQFEPDNRDALLNEAQQKARIGITLDSRDSICLQADSFLHSMLGLHDIALSKVEQAVALNINDASVWYRLGYVLGSGGRPEEAVPHLDHALRLSPRDISIAGLLTYRAFVLFDLEHYQEAYETARRASRSPNPRNVAFETVIASLVKSGRREEAVAAVDEYLAFKPDASLSFVNGRPWIARPEAKAHYLGALRDAGLPE